MRRFLACSGIHSRAKGIDWLKRAVEIRRPHCILFAGGILDISRQYAAGPTPWGLTRADAVFMEKFFHAVGSLGVFSAIIPGPVDSPLPDFLRMGMHAEVEYPGLHLVHATLVEKGDLAICGLGEGHAPEQFGDSELFTRTMAEYHLRPFAASS